MKKTNYILLGSILFATTIYAQTSDADSGPKMGFQDFGLSLGHKGMLQHINYDQNTTSEVKTKTNFINIHMSESMLSNWWNADDNTRFLFGIRECLDVGLGTRKRTETITSPGNVFSESTKKLELIFTYEGGLGGLYRINKKMDVAFNYFIISISSFNKTSDLIKHVPQFKFRYDHYMAEITLRARTAFEFKYLPDAGDDLQYYFGLSYTFWKEKETQTNKTPLKANYFQLTCGWQM